MSDSFHDRFSELMSQKGWTQDIGANKFGVSRVSISKYMGKGKDKALPNYDLLIKIADTFDVSVDFLLGRADEPSQLYKSESKLTSEENTRLLSFMNQTERMLREKAQISEEKLEKVLHFMRFTFIEDLGEKKSK